MVNIKPYHTSTKASNFGPTTISWNWWKKIVRNVYYVSVCICGINTNHASTYQKGIIGMYLCVFLFSYTIFFLIQHKFILLETIRNMASNPSDRFKSNQMIRTRNLPKQIKNWLGDKDEAKRFGNEWKIVATKNTKRHSVKAKRKRKWAHRIIYESVENYATIVCVFRQYRQA